VPNPSRGAFAFSYVLTSAGTVALTVFDATGRRVATLDAGEREVGAHPVQWNGRGSDGRRLPAGLYFVRLALVGGKVASRKVVLLP
jgi:flagellar hook assembly protein FlgD